LFKIIFHSNTTISEITDCGRRHVAEEGKMKLCGRILALVFVLLSLSGCATTFKLPPKAEFHYPEHSKIAVVNAINEKLWQIHVGTTILTNSRKEIDSELNLKHKAQSYLKDRLFNDFGYELVELQPEEWKNKTNDEKIVDFSIFKSDADIKQDKKEMLENISRKEGYIAVIFMTSFENDDFIEDTNQKISHYGVFSRSVLGLSRHYVYYIIHITGISLNPPYNLGSDRTKDLHVLRSDWKMEMYAPFENKCINKSDSIYADCHDVIDEIIWLAVKKKIDSFLDRLPTP
jgi:hypothetical protein